MSEWKTWNLQRWNERLLAYFFRSGNTLDERASPVVVLLVTADELAHATGDPTAKADDVRAAFVEAVCAGIQRAGSLLEDASDYQGWPGAPCWDVPPRFVAHLLFTCIAASESSEELGDEGSFVGRLRVLTREQLPDHSLHILPRLWLHLAAWLQTNTDRYRPLVLPNPGGFTRIGYTVKLAFPDRRDQRQLSDLLDRAGLSGHEPPVGRVLALISSERRNFRPSFVGAFDEFRRLFETANKQSVQRLAEHRFWAAVRDAALRGRGQGNVNDFAIRVSLLAEEEEGRIVLFAASDDSSQNETAFAFLELPIAYGSWRYALVPPAVAVLDAQQLEHVVNGVLDGTMYIPKISSLVQQGILPFVAAPHGLLELAVSHEQLAEVSVALVREALVPDLIRLLGQHSIRASIYEGWVQILDPRLRSLSSEEVEQTALAKTWILQQSLGLTTCRIIGGVRADDGWLGVSEILPTISARGASGVTLEGPNGALVLAKSGDDAWTLPAEDIVGEFTISVALDGAGERRAIRFHSTPATEAFKAVTDPAAWIIEDVQGTGTLAEQSLFAHAPRDEDCATYCERVTLLGRDVGAFVSSQEDAAWRLTNFGGKLLGSQAHRRGADAVPQLQVDSAHARRRWRTMLFNSIPDPSDPHFDESRRQARGAANNRDLPRLSVAQLVPDIAPLRLSTPTGAVARLVRVVAGRVAASAGLDWREWAELVQKILRVDEREVQRVTRAWMEGGLIDVASYARWWHRRIFAKPPQLVAFRVCEGFGATLSGLVLPSTIDEGYRTANRFGLSVEERASVSPLVPRSLVFRAPSQHLLESFAATSHLPLRWLDLAGLLASRPRHDGLSDPPQHYERMTRWHRWSLAAGDHPSVLVERYMRRDRPHFWTASADGRHIWSYDLNVTRGWAATLLGEPLVSATNEAYLDVRHAYLPLPLARVLSILGGGFAGPIDSNYRYVTGNPQLRNFVLDVLSRVFDPSRLVARATEQATG